MEEQQRAALKPLVRLLGKEIVAVRNQRPLIFNAEDSGIERSLGNSRIDRLAGDLEKSERFPLGVKIVGIDGCQRAALFRECFGGGALELKLGTAQNAGHDPVHIEAKQLQIDGEAGLGSFQR